MKLRVVYKVELWLLKFLLHRLVRYRMSLMCNIKKIAVVVHRLSLKLEPHRFQQEVSVEIAPEAAPADASGLLLRNIRENFKFHLPRLS